jgi:hypothetical protein
VSVSVAVVYDDVEPVASERRDRVITGVVTAVPILSVFFVTWQLWDSLLGWNDIFVFLLLYVLTGLGVTVGFHRLLTHRAFKTTRPVRASLAILGSAAIERPVICTRTWGGCSSIPAVGGARATRPIRLPTREFEPSALAIGALERLGLA